MQNEWDTNGLRLGIINIRSVKNKDLMVARHMIAENINAMVLTKTWLKQNKDDQLWKKKTCLANQNFNSVGVERPTGHRGGGLALITNENIKINLIECKMIKTFEFAVWKPKIQNKELQLMGVYHSPPLKIHLHTDQMFIGEFLELYMEISVKFSNLMISGDFNIHYFNDEHDSDQLMGYDGSYHSPPAGILPQSYIRKCFGFNTNRTNLFL